MGNVILNTIITTLVSMAIGYFISQVKNKRSKNKVVEKALLTLLQSNLTNTYFVYEQLQEIPEYVYENWLNELSVYETLGGNSYIHQLAENMTHWHIKHYK